MQVDFFNNPHSQATNATDFGLCDDQNLTPAYIDITDQNKWIAHVVNHYSKTATFYPIDNCIATLRPDGNMDNRCDGLLKYDSNLIFVELKDRDSQGWVGDGLTQLKTSIGHFKKAHHDILVASTIKAHLCNKQRPRAVIASNVARARFKDETGYIAEINRVIELE